MRYLVENQDPSLWNDSFARSFAQKKTSPLLIKNYGRQGNHRLYFRSSCRSLGHPLYETIGLSAGDPSSSADISEEITYVAQSHSVVTSQGRQNFIPEQEALTMVGMMMSMGADDSLIDSTREGSLGDEELDALNEAFNQLYQRQQQLF